MTKDESYEQKKRRLFGKQKMQEHLYDLNLFLNCSITENHLLSIVDTDSLLERIDKEISLRPDFFMTVHFEDRKEQLEQVIKQHLDEKSSYYLWIYSSDICGIYLIDSLFDLNLSFPWDAPDLLILIEHDLKKKVVLDWYEEDENFKLDIVLYPQKSRL